MKIAIVHDWLVTNGGAEKVLKSLLDLYPNADIFSLVDFLDKKDRDAILNGRYAKTSFIQKLPFSKKYFRNYLPLFPKAIESFDLGMYDLIFSSSWAVAKGVIKRGDQKHICYCHTPIRYAWDLYDEYISNIKQPKRFLVQKTLHYIRDWDKKSAKRVDFFVANSKFVKERIQRIYDKDATVIYPPVDTGKFSLEEKKEEFYLTASRLVPYKKTRLIVEAFNQMPDKKLIVIGKGEEYDMIKKIAKSNIHVLGYQDDKKLRKYMQKAKAFVYAAIEDFGIVCVEAQACGTPVIALGYGGSAETVIDGETGIHFQNQTIDDIKKAVLRFEKMRFSPQKISSYAHSFSKERFAREFESFVRLKMEKE